MDFDELVSARRSIRKYEQGVRISENEVKEIISCGQLAPSWKNSQTARYYVAISADIIEEIRKNALPEFNANNCENAAALIVTAFEKKRAGFTREGVAEDGLGDEWGAYDLGLQNENILLKAKALGYDSLVMGIRDSEKLRSMLGISETQEVVAVIALGKRVEDAVMPKRKTVEDIVKFF